MGKRVSNLWTLGGLSVRELVWRTARECWRDEVFGQGGRMAFYQFIAMFPLLLIFFTVVMRVPHFGDHLKEPLRDLSNQIFPVGVSKLFQAMVQDFSQRPRLGARLLSVFAAAVWAAHNGTWAMIYGLNRAYETEEHRSWWKLTVTIVMLSVSLAAMVGVAVLLLMGSTYVQEHVHGGAGLLRTLEWVVVAGVLGCSFGLLYRMGPDHREHEWRWSTPGTVCALVLWIAATAGAHFYFDHFNNYTRSYGPLNGVVMLLLWLYASNGAILIGGEMNSEIRKAEAERGGGSGSGRRLGGEAAQP
jgi:membrane protein